MHLAVYFYEWKPVMKKIFLSCLLSILAATGWHSFREMNEFDNIHCYSQLSYVFYSDKDKIQKHVMNAGLIMDLSGGKGIISLSGDLDNLYSIRRNAEFTYTVSDKNLFSLYTTKVNLYPSDNIPDDLSARYVYGYLSDEGKMQDIIIKRNGSNGYMISTSPIPQFVCRKL